jgi:repressor LexA
LDNKPISEIGKRIKTLRLRKPMTQAFLANEVDVEKRTIINYEKGNTEPTLEMIEKIARVLEVSPDYIRYGKPTSTRIPVYGKVSAGIPLDAIEDIIDFEEIPEHWENSYEYFALKVSGDSMEPRMYSGDVIIVRKQSDINSGDIAVILVNGQDATIKKVIKSHNGITLQPLNFKYQPVFYSNDDIEKLPVAILGRVVELRAKY